MTCRSSASVKLLKAKGKPFATGIFCTAAWQFDYLFDDHFSTKREPLPSPPAA
jgi:hypothetical protein